MQMFQSPEMQQLAGGASQEDIMSMMQNMESQMRASGSRTHLHSPLPPLPLALGPLWCRRQPGRDRRKPGGARQDDGGARDAWPGEPGAACYAPCQGLHHAMRLPVDGRRLSLNGRLGAGLPMPRLPARWRASCRG